MLTLPSAVRVDAPAEPVDLRRGLDALAAVTRSLMGADPLSGHVFVFWNRRRNRLKLLIWDRSGFVLSALTAVLSKSRELGLLVAKLRRERVGRTSERVDPGQLALLFRELVELRSSALWGVDPLAYLNDILPKLANGWSQDRLHELLPGRWQPEPAAPGSCHGRTLRGPTSPRQRPAVPPAVAQPDPVGPIGGGSLPLGPASGGSERNLEKDTISRNDFDFSLVFRDECRSGWRQLHRHRDFARFPRQISITILGSLFSSTFVSPARKRAKLPATPAPSPPSGLVGRLRPAGRQLRGSSA